jgi:hypothetical protein
VVRAEECVEISYALSSAEATAEVTASGRTWRSFYWCDSGIACSEDERMLR